MVLTDGGKNYITKFYNDEWMVDNGFMVRAELFGTVADVLALKGEQTLLTVSPSQPIGGAIDAMKSRGVSQLPVVNAAGTPIGMLHEVDLLGALVSGDARDNDTVETIVKPLSGVVSCN